MAPFPANLAGAAVRSLPRTTLRVNTDSTAGAAGRLPVGVVRHGGGMVFALIPAFRLVDLDLGLGFDSVGMSWKRWKI